MTADSFDVFCAAPPGFEPVLAAELAEKGFACPAPVPGGVTFRGGWSEIWRANLELRGATRVLVRIAEFRALHLAQLDKRARRVDWASVLRPDRPVRVEATCRGSRIYHEGAASERVGRAIAETLGAPVMPGAALRLAVRIEDDLCTISLDASGEPLHRRGHKLAVGKAPLRETLAALFLRQCGYRGTEPVIDPMCGSGTFVIEAAEIALGLAPGRDRRFAFEDLASFDAAAWAALKDRPRATPTDLRFLGADRDAGAVRMSTENAARAGLGGVAPFLCQPVSALEPPEGPPGLVIVNPPYGARIGNARLLHALYAALGRTLAARFSGWRVGIVTSEHGLARATGLKLSPLGPPVPHGGMKIALHGCGPLP